eukprot:TRINITY_DN18908_c0_g1_i1.p2 TRINITY_DN18908_c0_g1~~TRINITY_DN18908_c0_g1_i1.p2  ORF type:complete len:101 (-),score=10.61 TRINITY_DN18908_c0_g1_i1:54-356(-)
MMCFSRRKQESANQIATNAPAASHPLVWAGVANVSLNPDLAARLAHCSDVEQVDAELRRTRGFRRSRLATTCRHHQWLLVLRRGGGQAAALAQLPGETAY